MNTAGISVSVSRKIQSGNNVYQVREGPKYKAFRGDGTPRLTLSRAKR
jgi:hypothetical protein